MNYPGLSGVYDSPVTTGGASGPERKLARTYLKIV